THEPTSAPMCCIPTGRTVRTKIGGIAAIEKTRGFCGLLSRRSCNISAVDGQNSACRLARKRKTDERFRNVFGQNLPAQKIAGEIVVLSHATRLRAFLDQGACQQSGSDTIVIHGVGCDSVAAMVDGI